ncbi:MAG: TonB-dependent receptor domain-containing protein, partial [Candidatus Aminicenantaceae bacterium]
RYFNIGEARIHGFELQAQKSVRWGAATINYTFLDPWNVSDDRPLPAISKHNLNFEGRVYPLPSLRLSLYGLLASSSYWLTSDDELVEIPSYFNLDAVVAFTLRQFEIFARLTNIFDSHIYTELGFPWRGRYFELGFRADVF